jgi:transcription elongation GreA/GreB family factor
VRLLEEAATIHGGRDSAVRRAITQKIRNAVLELREDIPAGYVTLGCRVTFRVNGQMTLSRVLVHWDAFSVPGLELSLATPWGIALLGMRAGSEAPVYWRDGSAEMIKVKAVEEFAEPARIRRATTRQTQPTGDETAITSHAAGRPPKTASLRRGATGPHDPGPFAA